MEISTQNMESVFSREKRPLDRELSNFELPLLIESMKQTLALENTEINSIILIIKRLSLLPCMKVPN